MVVVDKSGYRIMMVSRRILEESDPVVPPFVLCCGVFIFLGLLLALLGCSREKDKKNRMCTCFAFFGPALASVAGFVLAVELIWPDDLSNLDPLFNLFDTGSLGT